MSPRAAHGQAPYRCSCLVSWHFPPARPRPAPPSTVECPTTLDAYWPKCLTNPGAPAILIPRRLELPLSGRPHHGDQGFVIPQRSWGSMKQETGVWGAGKRP